MLVGEADEPCAKTVAVATVIDLRARLCILDVETECIGEHCSIAKLAASQEKIVKRLTKAALVRFTVPKDQIRQCGDHTGVTYQVITLGRLHRGKLLLFRG